MARLGLAVLICLVAAEARAQTIRNVWIDPPHPTSLTPITLTVSGEAYAAEPVDPVVTVEGSRVVVTFARGSDCCLQPLFFTETVRLGVLPGGNYDLVLRLPDGVHDVIHRPVRLVVRDVTTFPLNKRALTASDRYLYTGDNREITAASIGGREVDAGQGALVLPHSPPLASGLHDLVARMADGTTVTARNAIEMYDPAAGEPTMGEKVLVPILYDGPGAGGTRWTSVLEARTWAVSPPSVEPAVFDFHHAVRVPAKRDAQYPSGLILRVDPRRSHVVEFFLTIRETTRSAPPVAIPVVREHDFLSGSATLRHVPFLAGRRLTLRMYRVDGPAEPFHVVVGDRRVIVDPIRYGPGMPAFAAFDLSTFDASGYTDVQVVVSNGRFWAMVTAVNTATNETTVIVPN